MRNALPVHSRSVGSAGLGLIAFALSFLGVPRIAALLLLALGVFLLLAAVLFWTAERSTVDIQAPDEVVTPDESPLQRLLRNLDIAIQYAQGHIRNIDGDASAAEFAGWYEQSRQMVLGDHPRFARFLPPADESLVDQPPSALRAEAARLIGLIDHVRLELRWEDRKAIPAQSRVEFGCPRRFDRKTFQWRDTQGVKHEGSLFAAIVLPVTARDDQITNCRSDVTFFATQCSFEVSVPGRWENRSEQPAEPYGSWSHLDTITLLKDESDAVAISVQHEGDDKAYILCNRSWEMPLQHGQPDFRHPALLLPRGEGIRVVVTVRGDGLADSTEQFWLRRVNGV